MHRTEGANNAANLFANGPPGTRLEENWLNSVQEEIIAVLTAAGIDPLTADTDTRVQLAAAVALLIAAVDGIVEQGAGSDKLKVKVIEIGDWDMNATNGVNVAHGLTINKIRSVSAMIRSDTGNLQYHLNYCYDGNPQGWITLSAGNVGLNRIIGGEFDAVGYDATPYNRGWITIWYVV